jgi:hypothetical protein
MAAMRGLRAAVILWGVLGAPAARAQEDIDLEVAKKHFAAASELYARNKYEAALAEFKRAALAKPLPDIDYNIALCLDRLERFEEAIEAYRRYLASKPPTAERERLEGRIAELKRRMAVLSGPAPKVEAPAPKVDSPVANPPPAPPPVEPAPRRRLTLALGIGAAALLVGGAVAEGVAVARFSDAQACKPTCDHAVVVEITTPETVAWVMIGAGVAAAVATVIAWVVEGRPPAARVGPIDAGGAGVHF